MAESKFSRYIIYALGEIVLVVIGILIALAVNTWNQDNKDRKLGEDLLIRMQRDLTQDTTDFNQAIARNSVLRNSLKDLLTELYNGVESMEEVQQMSLTWDLMLDQAFSPNDNTYRSMLSSGTLGLIQNPDLKESILALYSDYDETGELLSSIGEWMIGIASYMDSQTDFIKFSSGVSDIFSSPEMFNESDFKFLNDDTDPRYKLFVRSMSSVAYYQTATDYYRHELINKCKLLLEEIESELKN